MPDPISDDCQALLDKEFGDKRILEQILRAAQNDEVISNFERNYVRKLAEKHLGKKPPEEKKAEPKPVIPDVEIPPPTIPEKPLTVQTLTPPPKITKSSSKNNQIIIGVGIATLAIIIIAAIAFSGMDTSSPQISSNQPSTSSFSIKTDLSSYENGDIISISGNSKLPLGSQITISIENPDNELIWSEEVFVKIGGIYSTLTFAGGPGWEESGTFTIIAESDRDETSNTFSFTG